MRGHIRKRGKRWALVIPLGRDPGTKKPKQKWYSHRTRTEAEAHLTEIRAAMQGGGGWDAAERDVARCLPRPVARHVCGRSMRPQDDAELPGDRRRAPQAETRARPLAALSAHAIDNYVTKKILNGTAPSSAGKHLRLLRARTGEDRSGFRRCLGRARWSKRNLCASGDSRYVGRCVPVGGFCSGSGDRH